MKCVNNIIDKIYEKLNKNNKTSKLLLETYYNGKKNIPFIVLSEEFKKGEIKSSHYCKEERLAGLIKFCKAKGISYQNYGVFEKTSSDGSKANYVYITLHVNGKYLSGQSFHRVIVKSIEAEGINIIPKHILTK